MKDGSSKHEVAERVKQLGQEWRTIEISKQDQFVGNILKRVTMGHAAVWIEIDKTRLLATLLARKPEALRPPQRDKAEILELNGDFRAQGGGTRPQLVRTDRCR